MRSKLVWASLSIHLVISSAAFSAEKCRDWTWQNGSRKSAQFGLNSELCVLAENSQAIVRQVKAMGEAEGYLLDKRIPLLRAEASTKQGSQSKLRLDAGVFVVGQKVWSPAMDVNTPSYQQNFSLPALDMEFPYRIQLGPIGVKLAAGVRGAAGVELQASAELAQLQAHVRPKLDTSGYAMADVNLWLAFVGAEGALLFARGELDLGASSQIVIRDGSAYLTGAVQGLYDLKALEGRLSIYADTAAARRRGAHSWERQLLGFDGFSLQGSMFTAAIPDTEIF